MKCTLNEFFSVEIAERNHKMVKPLFMLQNGLNHGLSKDSLRKFQMKLKFWQLILMKIANYFTTPLAILALATLFLIVYISQDYNFHLIILVLFFVAVTYLVVVIASTLTMGVVSIYAIALYLRMRFQQITKQFEEISAKNIDSLQSLIRDHNRVTVMTKDCDTCLNKLMAIVYFYAPVCINLALCTLIYGKSSIYTRSGLAIIATFASVGTYLFSYTSTQVSTEAHRCYNIINSINARNKIQLQAKLKVRL